MRLRQLREEKRLTQRQLAIIFGVPEATYVHYERDDRQQPREFLFKVADYFGVTIDYLIGYTDANYKIAI